MIKEKKNHLFYPMFLYPAYMTLCYIGLGSNLGDSFSSLNNAITMLSASAGITNVRCSKYYHTDPVDCLSDRPFLNAAAAFTCSLPHQELFSLLQGIESALGKKPKAKNAPRLIDIDLLFYGALLYYDKTIIIPHPRWHTRLFVIQPLAELTPVIHLSIPINIEKMLFLLIKKGATDERVEKFF